MPTLLCAADGEGQGQLSHLPQVSRGREAFFLTHATTWPGGGRSVLLSCPPGLLTCTPSTGQLYCVVQVRCRTCSPMCSCRWRQYQFSHSDDLRASSPTGCRQCVAEQEWSQVSCAHSQHGVSCAFVSGVSSAVLSARCRATLQLGSARVSSPSLVSHGPVFPTCRRW